MIAATEVDGTELEGIQAAVLAWYAGHGRRLAFRASTDPYRVLVSETILQQTQVARGEPAWAAFIERFPTVESLAAAAPADVIRAWSGLGYNRRAVNLHRAARMVVEDLDGRFPTDVPGLEALPGVGPYTARAVGAIAFGLPVAGVDTNVRRVIGRVFRGVAGRPGDAGLQQLADGLVPPDRPADWTHALMDLGATLCRPRDPACSACPLRDRCRYQADRSARCSSEPASTGPRADPPGRPSTGHVPFTATRRWLRGRIVDQLRETPDAGWSEVDAPIGEHESQAVAAALDALAREGLIELDATRDPPRARLPVG